MENFKTRLAVLGLMLTGSLAGLVGVAGAANAQTDPVADGFTTMQGNVTTYGAAIVSLVLISLGIFLGVKYLRKGVNKA